MQTVRQLLGAKSPEIHAVPPDVAVVQAIRLMAEKGIGAVLVMDGARLAGILSERDYARKIVLAGRSSKETPVRDIMTTDVITVSPDDNAQTCMQTVTRNRIRHLPVVDGGRLVGFVSIGDLVKYRIDKIEAEAAAMRDYIAS